MFVSRKRMLEILEQAQEGDRTSRLVDRFLSFLIVTNILAVSLESVESIGVPIVRPFSFSNIFRLSFSDLSISCVSGPAPNAHLARHKQ